MLAIANLPSAVNGGEIAPDKLLKRDAHTPHRRRH